MNGIIELSGMKFHAFHGCLPRERERGAEYLVDFKCRLDIAAAAASDNLEDTLDYGRIYSLVSARMAVPSNLLEKVASDIADSIQSEFPRIQWFSVRVAKLNPPTDGPCEYSAVTVERL